jgi:hypothetical protein
MAGAKIVKGVLSKLVDNVVPKVDTAARLSDAPMLSRRLMVQDANKQAMSGQGGDYYFGHLLDDPDFKLIDDQLDIVSQEHQYRMDPDFYDENRIDVTDILPETDTKDQAMGEAFLHYFSDGKHQNYGEFFPSIYESLENLKNKFNISSKNMAKLLEDSGYGPKTNVYANLDNLDFGKDHDTDRVVKFISETKKGLEKSFWDYKTKHTNSTMDLINFKKLYDDIKK